MPTLNRTYEGDYVIVSKEGGYAVLRVVGDGAYNAYWKEFIHAKVADAEVPMYLRIEQTPPDTALVDQYAPFTPELPIVWLEAGDEHINVTDRVTANTPNTEVPGLFRIDYRVNLSHQFSSPIWASYVSVQQRPVLRKAAAGWTRDSYVIRTLNRLVMEPQFMEALHAAGEPLYGFMEANQHPSVKATNLSKYEGMQAWGAGGVYNDSANGIFITGEKLPQGSIVIYNNRMLQLREPVWPDPIGAFYHMNPFTRERSKRTCTKGSVVRNGDYSYICVADTTAATPTGDAKSWCQGYLYKYSVLNGDDSFTLPRGLLPVGEGGVEHIWITVDDQGYSFWVDIAHQTSLGAYRGYYDRKNYADYGTGDIVAYISEDSVRLYKRKATDIQAPETLMYPPGHHLNPAWDEIYARFEGEHSPLFGDSYIVPHTNAANAIVAKTWSVSTEMCHAFAHMVGIPDTIVKECGAKWSALLFALLSRTRNTFEGFRACFRAVGLDVTNLRLSQPSIAYYCKEGNTEEQVEDIYTQHENLRKLIANIDTLAPEGAAEEKDGALRYVTESTAGADGNADEIGVAIQQYSETEGLWVTRYRFAHYMDPTRPIQDANNRYYKCDLDVLARLAEDAVADLGDGRTWVKESAWAGSPSALVSACLKYEIPIYIWLILKMNLYAENKVEMQGFAYSGLFDGQRGGTRNVIELHPTRFFSHAEKKFIEVDTGVFQLVGEDWIQIAPDKIDNSGVKTYVFDGIQENLRIMAIDRSNWVFDRYWQSTHTFGLLGLASSTSTDNYVPITADTPASHFRNITDPEITDETPLVLMNGRVGVTAMYKPRGLRPASGEALRWMYVLQDDDTTWTLDDSTPFTGFGPIGVQGEGAFGGSISTLKSVLVSITDAASGGEAISFAWDGDVLVLHNCMPRTIYLKNNAGDVLLAIDLAPGSHTLDANDWAEYHGDDVVSVRIGFIDE